MYYDKLLVIDLLVVAYWHHMVMQIWLNIDSGNGPLPDGTPP